MLFSVGPSVELKKHGKTDKVGMISCSKGNTEIQQKLWNAQFLFIRNLILS